MKSLVVMVAAALLTSCGPSFDVEKAVKVTDVRTGWYDAGIVDGKNKLVPSISLKLQNISDQQVASVQVFVRLHGLGDAAVDNHQSEPLQARKRCAEVTRGSDDESDGCEQTAAR